MSFHIRRRALAVATVAVGAVAAVGGIANAGPASQGPIGEAVYAGSGASIELLTTNTTLISLTLTTGVWSLNGTVLLNNLSQPAERVPVVCSVDVPTGGTGRWTLSAVDLAPYFASQGGDGTTLPVSGVATITAKSGTVVLKCLSNTGPDGARALAEMPQLTAVKLAQLDIQRDPFQS